MIVPPSSPLRRSTRVTTALAAALLAAVAVLALASAPAGAHGGGAALTVTELTRDGDEVAVTATLIFEEDGHGVEDATVTVVVDETTPVPMTGDAEGTYTATVTAPPGSTLRITSVEPEASVEVEAPPAEATTTTASTEPSSESTTTEAPSTDPNATTSASTTPGATSVLVGGGESEEDNTVIVLLGITAAVGAVGALCIVFLLRARKLSSPGTDTTDGSGSDSDDLA